MAVRFLLAAIRLTGINMRFHFSYFGGARLFIMCMRQTEAENKRMNKMKNACGHLFIIFSITVVSVY